MTLIPSFKVIYQLRLRAEQRDDGRREDRHANDDTMTAIVSAAVDQILDAINDSGYKMAGYTDALLFSHGDRGGLLYGPSHPEHAMP